MNRREFIVGVAATAAAAAFPTTLEAAPATVVVFNPTEAQIKDAAKRGAAGAATEAAAGEATKRGGGLLGGIRRLPGAGTVIDKATQAGTNLLTDNGKGVKNLLGDEVAKDVKTGPVVVFFGADAQSAQLKTAIDTAVTGASTLVIVDSSKNKTLADGLKSVLKEHEALGSPLVQVFVTDAEKPAATMNAFQVTPDVLKNIIAAAPAAKPGAENNAPAAPADGAPRRRPKEQASAAEATGVTYEV